MRSLEFVTAPKETFVPGRTGELKDDVFRNMPRAVVHGQRSSPRILGPCRIPSGVRRSHPDDVFIDTNLPDLFIL